MAVLHTVIFWERCMLSTSRSMSSFRYLILYIFRFLSRKCTSSRAWKLFTFLLSHLWTGNNARKRRSPTDNTRNNHDSKAIEGHRRACNPKAQEVPFPAAVYVKQSKVGAVPIAGVTYSLDPSMVGEIQSASRSSPNLARASRDANSDDVSTRLSQSSGTGSLSYISMVSFGPNSGVQPPIPNHSSHSVSRISRNGTSQGTISHDDLPFFDVVTAPNTPVERGRSSASTRENSRNTCLGARNIVPIMPIETRRYLDRPRIQRKFKQVTIPAMTTVFQKPVPPPGWTRYVHPEGPRYFVRRSGNMNILTESDIFKHEILEQLEGDIATIEQFIGNNHDLVPSQSDLVVDARSDDERVYTGYYFANHVTQTIFFLDDYEAENMDVWHLTPGAESECHLGHEIEAQYWYFILLFPHSLRVTKPLVQDLRSVMHHFIGDCMTSDTSNSPYPLEDLHKLVALLNPLSENVRDQDVGTASLVGRLMFTFARERFLNFYGEPHSRIERGRSIYYTDTTYYKWLVETLSPVMFYAPHFNLERLRGVGVDDINYYQEASNAMLTKLNSEWQQFIFFGTVMLAVNVSFLAIQSVDGQLDVHRRSSTQVCSYISVIASMGSILLGLFLTGEFRINDRETTYKISKRLRFGTSISMEILAIRFSSPYVLSMWGMIAFLAAFASLCFQSSDLVARAVVGFAFVVTLSLVSWFMVKTWRIYPGDTYNQASAQPPNNARGKEATSPTARRESIRMKLTALPSRLLSAMRRAFPSATQIQSNA
ncbi:hypothetical protein CPC08DRAFT_712311 [Agrocybe pediades]|nr:hypothetical protein CPC08DRAFT_712311 [Agrocybe pediades]